MWIPGCYSIVLSSFFKLTHFFSFFRPINSPLFLSFPCCYLQGSLEPLTCRLSCSLDLADSILNVLLCSLYFPENWLMELETVSDRGIIPLWRRIWCLARERAVRAFWFVSLFAVRTAHRLSNRLSMPVSTSSFGAAKGGLPALSSFLLFICQLTFQEFKGQSLICPHLPLSQWALFFSFGWGNLIFPSSEGNLMMNSVFSFLEKTSLFDLQF
jgi:hypothetical protein